jgi:2-oxoglutarate/2-oxoacid ferredoxin oxidoreductase subunit alpha
MIRSASVRESVRPGPRPDVTIRIGGAAGEGVVSAGELLARAAARAGCEVFAARNVPTEVQGGHAFATVRLGAGPVRSAGDALDLLVALDGEAVARHRGALRAGGILLREPGDGAGGGPAADGDSIDVPFEALARQATGAARARNLVALGACAGLLDLPPEPLEALAGARYAKGDAGAEDRCRAALRAGRAAIRGRSLPVLLPPASPELGRLMLTGNEAVALGAVAAGCRRFYGYPITPATEILEILAAELPARGGSALSVEDELAALAMCLGSAFAGDKAMTATSGPGFSLMAELLGLAATAEIPVVVVDVQRAGPCTGMPTKTEQGDLLAAVFGGHGDFPRAVLAPLDVEDAFLQIVRAFNLAESRQMPVIVLSDQDLAQRLQTATRPDVAAIRVVDRARAVPDAGGWGGRRYADLPGGYSPMPPPGTPGLGWRASGQEHDETGMPSADPVNRVRMVRRRASKQEGLEEGPDGIEAFGDPSAETLVLGWGSTYGAAREAVERLASEGVAVRALYPRLLWPYPAGALAGAVARARRVIVPETGLGGSWARLVEMHHGVRVCRVNRCDGRPFEPGELVLGIRDAIASGPA